MSIQPTGKISTGAKIAAGIGTVAVVGATVYAGLTGKKALGDSFEKSAKGVVKAIGTGYASIGQMINAKAIQPAWNFIKSIPSIISGLFHKSQEVAQEVAEKA